MCVYNPLIEFVLVRQGIRLPQFSGEPDGGSVSCTHFDPRNGGLRLNGKNPRTGSALVETWRITYMTSIADGPDCLGHGYQNSKRKYRMAISAPNVVTDMSY